VASATAPGPFSCSIRVVWCRYACHYVVPINMVTLRCHRAVGGSQVVVVAVPMRQACVPVAVSALPCVASSSSPVAH